MSFGTVRRQERGGRVVWFYKEMSQQEALPVLLRALDHGETWLQVKAARELNQLTVPFATDFGQKTLLFFESIQTSKLSPVRSELSPSDTDRFALKVELAILLVKLDRNSGLKVMKDMATNSSQPWVRGAFSQILGLVSRETKRDQ